MHEPYQYLLTSPDGSMASFTMDLDAMLSLGPDTATPAHRSDAIDLTFALQRTRDRVLVSGWAEGAERASAMSEMLAGEVPAVASIRQRWEYGPEGEELDADRALAGDWDMAYRRPVRRKMTGQRLITIASSFGGRAYQTHETMFWSGAQLAVATDVLEAAGYRVEAHAVNVSRFKGGMYGACNVIVKRPEDVLRPDMIMAVAGYADTFRSFGFLGKCHYPRHFDLYGFGSTLEQGPEMLAKVEEMTAAGLLPQIDNWMPPAYNRTQAIANVISVLHAVTGGEVASVQG